MNDTYNKATDRVISALDHLNKYQSEAYSGYMKMRSTIFKAGDQGYIPTKYKHLLFAIFDLTKGYLDGMRHHVRAAIDSGLTIQELTEGMVMVMMLTGIPSFLLGSEVLPWAEGYIKEKTKEA
jgi:alkylhydroperoxidase/carboxymuconolactone decarboxylase family protein YurZ